MLQVTLDSNTFCEVKGAALHFGTMLVDTCRVSVRNNLFVETNLVAQVDQNPTPNWKQLIAPMTGNVRDTSKPDYKEGNLPGITKPFALPKPLVKDINDAKQFLRYPNDSPLATMADGKPVGMPPSE
jgi:hypothetical protein